MWPWNNKQQPNQKPATSTNNPLNTNNTDTNTGNNSTPPSSPEKKDKRRSRSHFVEGVVKRKGKASSGEKKDKDSLEDSEQHPLNFYLQSGGQFPPNSSSKNKKMSSPRDSMNGGVAVNGGASAADPDKMETTPAPESSASLSNEAQVGENGQQQQEQRPTPPPHRTKTTPPPPPEIRPEEAEAFKASGNKFYKAGQYGKAIDEYTKGWWKTSSHSHIFCHFR